MTGIEFAEQGGPGQRHWQEVRPREVDLSGLCRASPVMLRIRALYVWFSNTQRGPFEKYDENFEPSHPPE